MHNDHEDFDEEFEETVPLTAYLEMTARLVGRITALEAFIAVLLAERSDAHSIARRVDSFIIEDEHSRISANGTANETMQTHEWARKSAEAILLNSRRVPRQR